MHRVHMYIETEFDYVTKCTKVAKSLESENNITAPTNYTCSTKIEVLC